MKVALITFSAAGLLLAEKIGEQLPSCSLYLHEAVPAPAGAQAFKRVVALTAEIFTQYAGLVMIGPTGVAVRAVGPVLGHKTTDPAVVVVDVGGRYAISLLSGHEGGANKLALRVGNILGAEPIVTTTTEAVKNYIVGVGCRRGTPGSAIEAGVRAGLRQANVPLAAVRLLATADVKADEAGIFEAAGRLGLEVRVIDSASIRGCTGNFSHSKFVQSKVNLPAVAEPVALLAGRRTRLVLPKTIYPQITVAIAREESISLGLAPAGG